MVALPKTEDVRKAGGQAVEVLRTPLLAALGAGDLATQAVLDAVNRTRTRVNEGAGAARGAVDELPRDLAGVRDRLDPAELRKLVDEYTEAAQKLYQKLADQGEDTLAKLRTQPQVRRALDQLEEAIATLQERVGVVVGSAAGDARELADEVLAKVTRRTRSFGEKTARGAQRGAAGAAETVEELGDEVAHEVRSASRKAANRTAPRKAATTRTGTATRKNGGAPKR